MQKNPDKENNEKRATAMLVKMKMQPKELDYLFNQSKQIHEFSREPTPKLISADRQTQQIQMTREMEQTLSLPLGL